MKTLINFNVGKIAFSLYAAEEKSRPKADTVENFKSVKILEGQISCIKKCRPVEEIQNEHLE